ncbi:FAD/NAD(P)-binding domain-containing protein, partial [Aaosphaeria arxii CBS 175.79]
MGSIAPDMPQTNGTNNVQNGTHPTPLNIAIVGAGIGGLSAAIFLRQQGHYVTLYEQSRFANELGAAVHLAPNASSLLRRVGINPEDQGANPTLSLAQYKPNGETMFHVDVTKMSGMWQDTWYFAHRVHLHSELKRVATAEEGKGRPAVLKTSSRVLDVSNDGRVICESGEEIQADVVVGADGVHSKTRAKLPGAEGIKNFGSGKSAFRFLMPREKALADPETKRFAEKEGHLGMFFAQDRRVIIYPTTNNTLLNFVCIHPTAESEIDRSGDGEWSQQGHKSKLLEVYKDFDPALVKLLSLADEDTLKVWELLDMENLPTWTDGKLVLIGDAAHPFTPHQGQGAAQAIEDAASLGVVLPLGTPLEEIPERLKLYEKCRYERASKIQEYSRLAGRDLGTGPPLDTTEYTGYNFGHDEWDFSTQKLREHLWARKPNLYWRAPVSFGPAPGPRQDHIGNPRDGRNSKFRTASIKFATSRTVLQGLFPSANFRFPSPATRVLATLSVTTLGNLEWLGGRGYSMLGLYIHGVLHKAEDGTVRTGSYLPVLFEDLADPILSGREELGMPKVWSELGIEQNTAGASFDATASWLGSKFFDFKINGLAEVMGADQVQPPASSENEGLLWYKSIPSTGPPSAKSSRAVDSSYAVFLPNVEESKVEKKIEKTWRGSGSFSFTKLDEKALPTLHHVVERLAEIPVFGVVEATVVEGTGVSDVKSAQRI